MNDRERDALVQVGGLILVVCIGSMILFVVLAVIAAGAKAAEPVHVDALVLIDGQALHLPGAICRLESPAVYSREDGRLTLRLAGVTCTDRIFGDGFDAPGPVLPAWKEPR